MSYTLKAVDRPQFMATFADDVTTNSLDQRQSLVAAIAPRHLAKTAILHKNGADALPPELCSEWRPAARILGGYVGETTAARQLFHADIDQRLKTMDTIVRTDDSCLSMQAKFAMIRSVELSIRWKWMATHPTITSAFAPEVDDRIAHVISKLCVDGATLTEISRSLISVPSASGGLGFVSYATQGEKLYDIAGMTASWPPRKVETEEGVHIKQGLTSKQAGDAMLEAQPLPVDILSKHEFNARADKSTPWFRIVPVVKYLRIDNDAWRLMLTNFLRAELSYPSCGDHPGTFD